MRTLEEALGCARLHTVHKTATPPRLCLWCGWFSCETTSDVCRLCKHHKFMEDTDGISGIS
jgi:hypothetical protein